MDLDEYQVIATETAIYPGQGEALGLVYAALGLTNEAGELVGKIKKAIRDDEFGYYTPLTPERRQTIKDELGDVLWYVATLAEELDVYLSDVAHDNIMKLQSRKERGTLQGSGDER